MNAISFAKIWDVARFDKPMEERFQDEHSHRLFMQCRTTAVFFAIVALIYNSVQLLLPLQTTTTAIQASTTQKMAAALPSVYINPILSIAIALCVPIIFFVFSKWSEKNYPWVIISALGYFIGVRILDLSSVIKAEEIYLLYTASSMESADSFKQAYELFVTRLHLRFVLLYVWLIIFFRIPYRFSLYFCIVTVPLIEYVMFFEAPTVGGFYNGISFFFVIVLALVASWNLEDRERLVFKKSVDADDAHQRFANAQIVAREELQRERDEAQRASYAKSYFLRQALHDIRNPLSALGINFETFEYAWSNKNGTALATCTKLLERSFNELGKLVDDLFSLAGYEMGKEPTVPEPIPLRNFLQHIHDLYRPMAERKGIILRFRIPDNDRYTIFTNRIALERVVVNLMANAIKFTACSKNNRRGRVYVFARTSDDGRIRLIISDNGVGISSERQARVWGYGVSSPDTDNKGGTGLGLTLVRAVCKSQGIEVGMHSILGRGTRFLLGMPMTHQLTGDSAAPGKNSESKAEKSLRIIFIENNPSFRESIVLHLGLLRHDVVACETLDGCLENLSEQDWVPDIVITDFHLDEGVTGDQIISSVRSHFKVEIRAIILTADTGKTPIAAAELLGNVVVRHKTTDRRALARMLDE